CGHNIKEFDIPYLCRRMIINSVGLPPMLKLSGKKPWEAKHLIDTMELWKFGDVKNYTSLDLLAAVLEVDTPKDDIDGSQVGPIFWKEGDLQRIVSYCEKDVLTVAQILLRLKGLPLLTEQQIVSV
ncbi:MAG: ribonuclease H-like domain-containing protein, partial [Saprospiraceae bacterium]|nr:ribonuclease H-like domain-containing protein [Saprospiraceae bacterium]